MLLPLVSAHAHTQRTRVTVNTHWTDKSSGAVLKATAIAPLVHRSIVAISTAKRFKNNHRHERMRIENRSRSDRC